MSPCTVQRGLLSAAGGSGACAAAQSTRAHPHARSWQAGRQALAQQLQALLRARPRGRQLRPAHGLLRRQPRQQHQAHGHRHRHAYHCHCALPPSRATASGAPASASVLTARHSWTAAGGAPRWRPRCGCWRMRCTGPGTALRSPGTRSRPAAPVQAPAGKGNRRRWAQGACAGRKGARLGAGACGRAGAGRAVAVGRLPQQAPARAASQRVPALAGGSGPLRRRNRRSPCVERVEGVHVGCCKGRAEHGAHSDMQRQPRLRPGSQRDDALRARTTLHGCQRLLIRLQRNEGHAHQDGREGGHAPVHILLHAPPVVLAVEHLCVPRPACSSSCAKARQGPSCRCLVGRTHRYSSAGRVDAASACRMQTKIPWNTRKLWRPSAPSSVFLMAPGDVGPRSQRGRAPDFFWRFEQTPWQGRARGKVRGRPSPLQLGSLNSAGVLKDRMRIVARLSRAVHTELARHIHTAAHRVPACFGRHARTRSSLTPHQLHRRQVSTAALAVEEEVREHAFSVCIACPLVSGTCCPWQSMVTL